MCTAGQRSTQTHVSAADASTTCELATASRSPNGLRREKRSLFVRQAPRSDSVLQASLAARCLKPLTFSDFESEPGEFCRRGERHAPRLRRVVSACIVSK